MRFLREWTAEPWQRVSRGALIGWLVFYLLFFIYAATDEDGFLMVDNVNLISHEAGHLVFAPFGRTMNILGGTLGELLVPLGFAIYFLRQRHLAGAAFCSFWFFENFPYIARYMEDARTVSLPLVGWGDEHDWELLFTQWGVLAHDTIIGGWMRRLGWLGMIATVAWFAWRAWRTPSEE